MRGAESSLLPGSSADSRQGVLVVAAVLVGAVVLALVRGGPMSPGAERGRTHMDDPRGLDELAREVLDTVRYVALGTIDPDGRPRVSPVYFTAHRYADLYWVSYADTHHSANLTRDGRVAGVVFDSSVAPGPDVRAVYVDGSAREIPADELDEHLPFAFDPERRGGRAFSRDELVDEADPLRLWVLHVERCEVHVGAGHPTLGTGRDRRIPVDARP
jgi:nitroimidazol reductase NimA-like FMN-containing flavoprotein (pyridoxamine 5'-phosphate oxidase superfamily)